MLGSRFRRVIVNRPNLRIPFPDRFAERLRGKTVESVARRGKYLTVELSSGETLIMHLGMSGWFYVAPIGDRSREADPHDHVVFVMSSGQTVLFNDPRRFGFMDLASAGQFDGLSVAPRDGTRAALAGIQCRVARARVPGQEGVAEGGAARSARGRRPRQHLRERSVASRAAVAAAARPSTIATAAGAPKKQARQLAASIKAVLTSAIRRRESPYRSARFRVYEREGEPCLAQGCGGTIKRIWQAGRSTFYCPICGS